MSGSRSSRSGRPAACARGLAALVVVALALPGIVAADASSAARDDVLDAIREDLVQLRLEEVLADTDALLRESDLSDDVRAEVLILRSQAHVALGDLDAAAEDYEAILRVRPDHEPDEALTTPEASKRFAALRKRIVADVRLSLVPEDAVVSLPDRGNRVVTPSADGVVRLVAGARTLRFTRPGYDAWEESLDLVAGEETSIDVHLVPNARTVTFLTSVEGVAISIDGRDYGRTRLPEAGPGSRTARPAALTVEHVPLGEHEFAYVRPCYRTVRRTRMLNIDVLDPKPLTLPVLDMEPARTPLRVSGGPDGAEVLVDDQVVGTTPIEAASVCPGERRIEVRRDGRLLYGETVSASEGVPLALDVLVRPNVVLVGTEGWPAGFDGARVHSNRVGSIDLPDGVDLSSTDGWRSIELDRDVQLALAVVPAAGALARERRYLYSPLLDTVERLETAAADPARPAWIVNAVGVTVVDSRVAGVARVASVRPGGAGETSGLRIGDRILEIDGEPVRTAMELSARAAAAEIGATLGLRVEGADGQIRELPLVLEPSPRIVRASDEPGSAAWLAAWAQQWSIAHPADDATALAVLASVLAEHGRIDEAILTWGKVRFRDESGLGSGTVAYRLGRLLRQVGREADAIAAFRAAASSGATDGDDDGPLVAPAALDHLADLGVRLDRDPFTTP